MKWHLDRSGETLPELTLEELLAGVIDPPEPEVEGASHLIERKGIIRKTPFTERSAHESRNKKRA